MRLDKTTFDLVVVLAIAIAPWAFAVFWFLNH